ncbi:MAG: MBG domain-containing protein [Opitutaceae bacterium]
MTKAPATVTLGNLSQVASGAKKTVSATTDPASLAVNITYNGSSTAPSAAGSYAIVAAIDDPM